jgi:AraC-like DNA-binding protein
METSDAGTDDHPPTKRMTFQDERQPDCTLLPCDCEQIICLLDKIARHTCMSANELHRGTTALTSIDAKIEQMLEIYRIEHAAAALEYDRHAKLRADMEICCPPQVADDAVCTYEPCPPGGASHGNTWTVASRARKPATEVPEKIRPWSIVENPRHTADKNIRLTPRGPFIGLLDPGKPTPSPQDFRSGPGAAPGAQSPVGFRTFTEAELKNGWPPDMSGAKGGEVVLMSGNLWLKLSVDGGKTFTDIDWTKTFGKETTYGGWAGDQVVVYVPSIDCFVLYVQSWRGTGADASVNAVKIALASSADLKTFAGGQKAWTRQWDWNCADFGLSQRWLDFPDLTFGRDSLFVCTNVFAGEAVAGKVAMTIPLLQLKAGGTVDYSYAFFDTSADGRVMGSPAQNVTGNEFYWAYHVGNSKIRIYSWQENATITSRERDVINWPTGGAVAAAPGGVADWITQDDNRIVGATRRGNELWFAWTCASGSGAEGGFNYPYPQIQVARFDIGDDYKRVDQFAIWNPDFAFAYPSLVTNSDNEVGISLAWGGGPTLSGSHAVGILGDFVVWYGDASDATVERDLIQDGKVVKDVAGNPVLAPTRFGDYMHVRLAYPDTRFFGAFGYAVKADPAIAAPEVGKFVYSYVEFGRQYPEPSPVR